MAIVSPFTKPLLVTACFLNKHIVMAKNCLHSYLLHCPIAASLPYLSVESELGYTITVNQNILSYNNNYNSDWKKSAIEVERYIFIALYAIYKLEGNHYKF